MNSNLKKGIALILTSSLFTCTGQLIWKLASLQNEKLIIFYYIAGFGLYSIGALFMLIAFRFGELSILQPMLSFGYIVSIILAHYVLNEFITLKKVFGVFLIIMGMLFLSKSKME